MHTAAAPAQQQRQQRQLLEPSCYATQDVRCILRLAHTYAQQLLLLHSSTRNSSSCTKPESSSVTVAVGAMQHNCTEPNRAIQDIRRSLTCCTHSNCAFAAAIKIICLSHLSAPAVQCITPLKSYYMHAASKEYYA